jgi:hypothetical protein
VCGADPGDPALVDPLVRLGTTLVALPAAATAPGGVVERLLAAGIAVLLVR